MAVDPCATSSRRRWRQLWAVPAIVSALMITLLVRSLGSALEAPGSDSVTARLAEWSRGHGGSAFVNEAERVSYDLHRPKVGGTPTPVPVGTAGSGTETRAEALPVPAPIAPIAVPAVAGEGAWQTLEKSDGTPTLRVAFVRADVVHTSYLSAVAWLNPQLLVFELHPGTTEPGQGPWSQPSLLPRQERAVAVAAFNSGFRFKDANGGYYADGRTVRPLRSGAASLVFFGNGSVTVGRWGRDVTMGADVSAVRQNLDLIVDGGEVVPTIDDNTGKRWGATVGNSYFVWRSGIGITRSGAVLYAVGPRLSARTLAELLRRAGATRAMELDMNGPWTTFVRYHALDGTTVETKLLPQMKRPATLYDTTSSRDFIVARLRTP